MTYIGLTTTTLRRRMAAHRNHGGINTHFTETHDRKPLVTELLANTTIRHREQQKYRLYIAEAISILNHYPVLNTQTEYDFILPSARRRTVTTRRNEPEGENEPNVTGHSETPASEPTGEAENTNGTTVDGAQEAPSASGTMYQSDTAPMQGQNAVGRRLRPRHERPSYKE